MSLGGFAQGKGAIENGAQRALLEALQSRMPAPDSQCLIHRDLYDQQILLREDAAICLIDLDDMALGHPMLDLGNFIAHLHLLRHWRVRPEKFDRLRERLLRAYAESFGGEVSALAFPAGWYESVALARLSVFQRGKNREDLAAGLVDAGLKRLEVVS